MSDVQHKDVSTDEVGMRLDRWFKVHFPELRHSALEKLLRKGQIRVDGGRIKANRRLDAGETVRIPPLGHLASKARAPARPKDLQNAYEIRKFVIFEDKAIIALNKPFGLAVQGGTNTKRHIDGMLGALAEGGERPRLVHRLDRDTGGLLIVAKTRKAASALGEAFQKHDVEKTYWALTNGAPRPREGTITMAVGKQTVRQGDRDIEKVQPNKSSDAKPAITDYQILDEAGVITFVAMRPITGRTHQLRVHAAAIECPIVGDRKYGGAEAIVDGVSDKLNLFCRSMTFPHPLTGQKTTITAPLEGHMKDTWKFFSFDANATCEWPQDLR